MNIDDTCNDCGCTSRMIAQAGGCPRRLPQPEPMAWPQPLPLRRACSWCRIGWLVLGLMVLGAVVLRYWVAP